MYKLIRPLLFTQESEAIHGKTITFCQFFFRPWLTPLIRRFSVYEDERLQNHVFGITFKNPVGLAAGFDKDAKLVNCAASLGFGFMEVGTITARPQEGNPKPRLFRLKKDKALINRLGFNNDGARGAALRLKARFSDVVIGANIGKSKVVPNEKAILDYKESFCRLAKYVDFVVLNVSSPNTPGLRSLQEREPLKKLLANLDKLNSERKPLLVKIAPDLSERQIDDIIEVGKENHIAGIVATNTTTSRDTLKTSQEYVSLLGEGGLSGKPLTQRSTQIVRFIYGKTKGKLPIVGVGGIFCAKDAYEKIKAGASLVEIYTGLVYEGSGLVRKINRDLAAFLDRDGFKSIKDAIGVEASKYGHLKRYC